MPQRKHLILPASLCRGFVLGVRSLFLLCLVACFSLRGAEKPFLEAQLIFPLESWHNHSSSIVELPNGDLMVCWFNGSGERKEDDVKIEGARKRKGAKTWGKRFVMADTLNYPDTNCTLFVDPEGRLWLFWPTILAHRWETALLKYRMASKFNRDGMPIWEVNEVVHVSPGPEFQKIVEEFCQHMEKQLEQGITGVSKEEGAKYISNIRAQKDDELSRRLGWMTRAHPILLDDSRLIIPAYSDGFDCSLMLITDDWGKNWRTSTPLLGGGNIQPSIVQCKDGSLYTVMRDNGPPPKRLLQSESFDRGLTWTPVTDSQHLNSGTSAEIIRLKNGHWALINNDLEDGRYRLVVMISEDEGKTWPWKRYLEQDRPGSDSHRYHYPSLIQARDGSLHATYSYHLNRDVTTLDAIGKPARSGIKHAHFNEAWVRAGETP